MHVHGTALVVDDDPLLVRSVCRSLRGLGFDAAPALDLAEGRRRLADRPRLVLVDLVLGDERGEELLRDARAAQHAPIVLAMSATTDTERCRATRDAGAHGFVHKPLEVDALVAAIEKATAAMAAERAAVRDEVRQLVVKLIGRASMPAVEDDVRAAFVELSRELCGDNVRPRARMLRISREALQHIDRKRR
jgi:DNA-binding response OmpR family regulator